MTRLCRLSIFPVLLVLFAVPRPAPAATVWVDTGAAIDTVVADTDTAAPANPLAPLAAPVPFKGFRYPHVDQDQNVTFIADDPLYGQKGANHGIFRSRAADGQLQTLVSQDDLIPGTDQKFGFLRGLQVDERGVDFVFNATARRGPDRGLFHWSGGAITAVARKGVTVLPGDSAPITNIHWGALHAGRILYVARDSANHPVLVLHELKTGADRVLLRGGDPIPGHPGETFQHIAHQDWLDASSIVFRAGAVDTDVLNSPKNGRAGLYGWFDIRWDDPAALAPARLVTLADSSTPVPASQGYRFSDFYSAPVSGGLVGFRASDGVYFSEDGHPVRPVVDTETEIEGLFPGKFTGFGIWPAAIENGLVFTAQAGKGFRGVFLYRTDQDALYLLADNRATLEGKKITGFEIGSHPLVGRRFAVTADFADETSGVYLATIPARAFKRLSAASVGSR